MTMRLRVLRRDAPGPLAIGVVRATEDPILIENTGSWIWVLTVERAATVSREFIADISINHACGNGEAFGP